MTVADRTYFVFANTNDLMCWHNLRVSHSIISSGICALSSDSNFAEAYFNGTANYAPYVPNESRTSGFISRFSVNSTSHYTVEYDAECTRSKEFPLLPSRFSGIFAFSSLEDCLKANQLYGWDMSLVRKFTLADVPGTRVHRANMEIVSLMRGIQPLVAWNIEERQAIWRHYWSGGGAIRAEIPLMIDGSPKRQSFVSGELWEYLIEGRLELADS